VNFLALLGWSPGDDRELMTTQELIDSFTLEGISGGNAVFNTEKLDWMNGQYIARMPIEDLAAARGRSSTTQAWLASARGRVARVPSAARAAASACEAID
jgi:glutamyl/glutaminyl-tRNA synthetase